MINNINDHIIDSLDIIYYPLIDMASKKRQELGDQCRMFVSGLIVFDTGDQLRENIRHHETYQRRNR